MNEVVLITGASTGFGRTASEALAQRGYRVFATMRDRSGRNASTAEALWSLAKREGWNLDVLDMDVTDDASVRQAVQQALDRAGRIDVLTNNAGIGAQGITEAYTVEQFQQVFDVNLLGVVRVKRGAAGDAASAQRIVNSRGFWNGTCVGPGLCGILRQ